MKKATLFVLVIFMISLSSYGKGGYKSKRKGKSSDSKGYYAFSIGPSLPMGNYALAPKIYTDKGGAAKTGLHINVANFGYKIVQNFGICGIVSLGANGFNAEKVTGTKDKDSYWVYTTLMIGPLASFDLGDKLSLDIRPMGGLMFVASPEANNENGDVLIKSDQKSTFGINLGASCRYHLTDRVDLGLNLDYLSATPTFKPENSFGIEYEAKQKMTLLGVTLGMAFKF